MDEDVTLVRVYFTEADVGLKKRLIDELVEILHQHAVGGATVFRGVSGYGGHGTAQADLLHLSGNLPLTLEFFAPPNWAETAIEAMRRHKPGLHVVSWRAAIRR